MKLRVFCDFDGTVTHNDVGNLVFTTFGDEEHWWSLVTDWKAGHIDGRELWKRQSRVTRMTAEDLDKFAATQQLDQAFPGFVSFCQSHNIPVHILSDGMDAYIERIIKHHRIDNVQILANHLEIYPDGTLKVSFPYYEMGCGKCANCKGSHITRGKQPGETTLFVGDGYSDLCALAAADIVFAKNDLLTYCREKGLDCRPFQSFAEIRREVEKLLSL